jgi:hypothetical protein
MAIDRENISSFPVNTVSYLFYIIIFAQLEHWTIHRGHQLPRSGSGARFRIRCEECAIASAALVVSRAE